MHRLPRDEQVRTWTGGPATGNRPASGAGPDIRQQPVWPTPHDAMGFPSLADDIAADVAVIGAGISGLAAALDLAAAGRSVILLDAQAIGNGASAASAGQVGPLFYGARKSPDEVTKRLGSERAERLHRLVAASGRTLSDMIAAQEISCDFRPGLLCVFRTEASLRRAEDTFAQWDRYGGRWHRIAESEVRRHIGSDRYAGGVVTPDGGFLNPSKLIAGMAAAAARAGVSLFADSPALSLQEESSGWMIATPNGAVRARDVLIATGSSAVPGWPDLTHTAYHVPVGTAATAPLGEHGRSFLPAAGPVVDLDDKAIFAPALDADGRLLVSFLMSSSALDEGSALTPVERRLKKAFPNAEVPPFDRFSFGPIGVTPDGLPRLLQLAPRLIAVTGCNGFGLTLGMVAAREAARLIEGGSPEHAALPLSAPKRLPAASIVNAMLRNVVAPLANRFSA